MVLAVAAVAAGSLVATCGGPAVTPGPSPSASPPAVPATPTPVATPVATPLATPEPSVSAPSQPGAQEVLPSSPPKAVGEFEVLTLFTHCGLVAGRVDWAGSFWRETAREPDGGAIGDPEDTGRMTLMSATQARFESSTGTVVVLERVDGAVSVQPCD